MSDVCDSHSIVTAYTCIYLEMVVLQTLEVGCDEHLVRLQLERELPAHVSSNRLQLT